MDRYFTIMVIPSREKGVKSFKIPRMAFRAFLFSVVMGLILLFILGYDYVKILKQVYENKHLSLENKQLKEQIQLFQVKMNTLSGDINRIEVFEKKLRIITGLEDVSKARPYTPTSLLEPDTPLPPSEQVPPSEDQKQLDRVPQSLKEEVPSSALEDFQDEKEFKKLKGLYEQKIAQTLGLLAGYRYTKGWSPLHERSFVLADTFATIDYQFSIHQERLNKLELSVNDLDQYLLDKTSFLNSTPTLLPAQGWITSYYGPRMSPYSGRIKMHEGLDVGGIVGTPIVAPADGVITYSGAKPGFGNTIQIDHGYGLETIYAHSKSLNVKKGEVVKRGQLIARVGNTGYSTGPHLHYEIRVNGIPVDPLYYILD